MQHEVKEGSGISLREWRVEAIDFENDGACYVVIFSGPKAKERAEEYAEFKNGAVGDGTLSITK